MAWTQQIGLGHTYIVRAGPPWGVNRATWAIGLHLMDTVVAWINDDLGAWTTTDGADIGAAAQLFQDLVDEQIELADMPSAGLLMDLLDTSDVDWCALGRAALASSDRTSLEEEA